MTQRYLSTVRPMRLEFMEASKRYANVIVPEGGRNLVAMEIIRDLRSRERRHPGGSQQDAGVPRSNCVSPVIISRVQKLLDEAG